MKRYTKFVGLLLALFLIGRIGALIGDLKMLERYGAEIPYEVGKVWDGVRLVLFRLSSAGVAIWLFVEARRDDANRWVWALAGLIFGLIALILYYVISIALRHKHEENPTI